jgi:hypothetical protein
VGVAFFCFLDGSGKRWFIILALLDSVNPALSSGVCVMLWFVDLAVTEKGCNAIFVAVRSFRPGRLLACCPHFDCSTNASSNPRWSGNAVRLCSLRGCVRYHCALAPVGAALRPCAL